MPQKLGKGGHGQQNYVPPGDPAGGQYGDNESGSNKHFTNFSKPKGSIGIEKKGDNKIVYNGKEYTDEETKNVIKKAMGYNRDSINVTRVLEQLKGDNIDPKIKSLVLDTLASGNYKVIAVKNGKGFYRHWGREIHFESTDNSSYTNGEVFFHEVGHAIDYTYDNGHRLYSRDYVSTKYGKTMLQMKNEELGQFLENGGFDKIMEEYHKDEKNPEVEELRKLKEKLSNKLDEIAKIKDKMLANNTEYQGLKKELDVLYGKYFNDEMDWSTYQPLRNELVNKMNVFRDNLQYEGKDELPAIRESYYKTRDEYDKKYRENRSKLSQKYMDLSDMCQAINNKYKFHGGHDLNYFVGDERQQATETFAEIQSALGSNSASLELLQRYIPKTIEIYKEIIGGLK